MSIICSYSIQKSFIHPKTIRSIMHVRSLFLTSLSNSTKSILFMCLLWAAVARAQEKKIVEIAVVGNKHVPAQAILDHIPYRVGEQFDPAKTRTLINNLYTDLKRFRTIKLNAEDVGAHDIKLIITVEEKKLLKDVIIEGNSQITKKEIYEKVDFADLPAIDEEELKKYAVIIKKIYVDKGFHLVQIETQLQVEGDAATAIIKIKEHPKALVKRIRFKGNKHVSGKQLRKVIFSREDWLFGFMDKAGTYQPERINGDKHMIEQYYQNHGYINAKVIDVDVQTDPKTQNMTLVFEVFEGDRFTVKEVTIGENEIMKEEFLLSIIPIKPGDIYSRENIVEAIKNLEFVWGNLGYIYAHVNPSIQADDETKTVSIGFNFDIGNQVFLNKITIRGNRKTRDKIIRRKISLEEGALLSSTQMEASKNRIESLGYFDQRDGVTWKTTRLSESLADLDLIVKEIKTGDAHLKIGFGGSATSLYSSSSSVSVEGNISDSNFGGSGVAVNLVGKLSTDEKTANLNITQPWLFDRPIYGSIDLYHKRFNYDQFMLTLPVNEKQTGGVLTTGFVTGNNHHLFNDTFMRFAVGVDDYSYGATRNDDGSICNTPRARIPQLCGDPSNLVRAQATVAYDSLLAKLFEPGTFPSFSFSMGQDKKNHPMHPSKGIAWLARCFFGFPSMNSNIGYNKVDLDVNWYTPLIGDYNLIFRIHGFLGFIHRFDKHVVPYRELFHIGGPASVRGFLFGQIGPQFSVVESDDRVLRDSIGGGKAFFVNTELIFPILSDFSMKGVVFYDGGTGWDNPYTRDIPSKFLLSNCFDYRHAVGVGLRILNPAPIRVDWGFKLDPRKGEPAYEVHFGMAYDW